MFRGLEDVHIYGMKNPNLIFPAAYCTYVTHDDAKCQMAFVILPRVTYGHHECLLYFFPEPITKCQTHRSALLCNFHNLILTGIFTMHMDAYISVLQYDCNTLSAHNPGHIIEPMWSAVKLTKGDSCDVHASYPPGTMYNFKRKANQQVDGQVEQ